MEYLYTKVEKDYKKLITITKLLEQGYTIRKACEQENCSADEYYRIKKFCEEHGLIKGDNL